MTTCLECGEAYIDGALFCGECGASLLDVIDTPSTVQVPSPRPANGEVSNYPIDYGLGFGIKADRIIFVIPSSGRRLRVDLGKTVSIGRVDARQGIWPEVDLTQDEGAEQGVSRKHALVRNSDEGVMIIDLGSTNGTLVNDHRLPPKRPFLLSNGDTIRFGNLMVHVYFES